MRRSSTAFWIAIFILFFVAVPAFAQSLIHNADYDVSGDIWINKQVGHYCNTGAEQMQTIRGVGKLTKEMSIVLIKGKVTVDDENDFRTAADAVRNLMITSVIRLCTPPKHTYNLDTLNAIVDLGAYYRNEDQPRYWTLLEGGGLGWSGENWSDYANDWSAVSDQIWAARIEANPGYKGRFRQDYEAAYGPYNSGALTNDDDRWRLRSSGDSAERGPEYVGDYFRISQTAVASMGEVKRYIDISSPWSHGYIFEDFEALGFVEIRERFRLTNIRPGSEIDDQWFRLFLNRFLN